MIATLARRVPRTPRTKTTVCTLAVTALSASVASAVHGAYGGDMETLSILMTGIVFGFGVILLHLGHCADALGER